MYSPAEQKIRMDRWKSLTTMQRSLMESNEQMASIFEEYDTIVLPAAITNALSVRSDISHKVTDIIQQLLDPDSLTDTISPLLDRLDRLMEALDKISFSLLDFLGANESDPDLAS